MSRYHNGGQASEKLISFKVNWLMTLYQRSKCQESNPERIYSKLIFRYHNGSQVSEKLIPVKVNWLITLYSCGSEQTSSICFKENKKSLSRKQRKLKMHKSIRLQHHRNDLASSILQKHLLQKCQGNTKLYSLCFKLQLTV